MKTLFSQNFVIAIEGGSFHKAKRLAEKFFIKKLNSNPEYEVDRTVFFAYDKPGNMLVETYPFKKAICKMAIKLNKEFETIKTNQTAYILSKVCNGITGKFEARLRDHGLVYSASMIYDSHPDHAYFSLNFECSCENINKCIDQIAALLEELRNEKIDDKVISKIKENKKLAVDETITALYPSKLFYKFLYQDKDFFSKNVKKENKKVFEALTADDIQQFCKEVFSKPENIYVAILSGETEEKYYEYEKTQILLTQDKKKIKLQ